MLLDILGEPTAEPTMIYGLNDTLKFGKHKGKTLIEVVHDDFGWVEWAINNSEHFFCDIEAVAEERKKTIKSLHPEDVISFGKYKGHTIRYIYENDVNYLKWLMENANDFIIDIAELKTAKGNE